MKKFTALLTVGILILGLTACGTSQDTVQEDQALLDEEIEEAEQVEKRDGLNSIRETGKLIVCTSPDYAPFEFEDPTRDGTDRYVGADMSLARYLADQLDVELEIRAMGFEECLEAVSKKEADLGLLGMLPEKERQSLVDFTDVYYDEGSQSVLVLKDCLEEFPDMESFSGKTVAAQSGTVQAQLVVEQLPETYMEVVPSVQAGLTMLRNKMVDGVAVPTVIAEKLIKENADLAAAPEMFEYTSSGLVGCVPFDEPELKKTVNDAIEEVVKTGIYYEWMDEAYKLAAYFDIK